MIITRDLLSKWGACEDYQGDALDKFFMGRPEITAREACAFDIPHGDKMWLLTHALWERDPWLCYDFSLWCAEQSIRHVEPAWQERAKATLATVTGLRGQPAEAAAEAARAADEAARAARAADEAAAEAAAWAAAGAAEAAARAAAGAAEAAARAAAGAAAGAAEAAARAAAGAAAGAAARAAQISKALEMLEAPQTAVEG